MDTETCKKCKGSGKNRRDECGVCKGSGKVSISRDPKTGTIVAVKPVAK